MFYVLIKCIFSLSFVDFICLLVELYILSLCVLINMHVRKKNWGVKCPLYNGGKIAGGKIDA